MATQRGKQDSRNVTGAGRVLGWTALGAVALTASATLAAAAVAVRMARTIVTPPTSREQDIRILAVGETTITLSLTQDSMTPGQYSLWFDNDNGHARVGEILEFDTDSVTRILLGVDFGELGRARRGRFSGWYYLSPRELGYPHENVVLDTDLGPAPAWLIPAAEADRDCGRWVIQVHGRAVRRSETLRAVPAFREAGYTSLLVSYRNDGDAPSSTDNRYSLGDVEWRDVDAALRFAVDNGATDVVLMGWSMGGATVLQAATRSPLARVIRGIALDSPVIDWVSVLDFQGSLAHVPSPIRRAALALLGQSWGRRLTGQAESIDLRRLDFVRRAGELHWPILLMHSDDDGYVPAEPSRELALARPDIVDFVPFITARHTKLWNYDAPRWNAAITGWLARLPVTPTR